MRTGLVALAIVVAACTQGAVEPASLDTKNEACAHCRMAVSDPRFAAQLVAPREEPRFFDDVGCLRDYLQAHPDLPRGTVAYVADHRTKAWVRAGTAAYARVPGLHTPMSSHLVAYTDAASRAADPDAAAGEPVTAAAIFGARGPPGGPP